MDLVCITLQQRILPISLRILSCNRNYARLAEVGRLETPKVAGKYDTGQLILHRVFGYRGVVLFPWLARVYDRDLPQHREGDEEPNAGVGKEVRGRTHTFYQVLIDQRDCPYIGPAFQDTLFVNLKIHKTSVFDESFQIEGLKSSMIVKGDLLILQPPCTRPRALAKKDPHLTKRAQTEAVTFLGNQDSSRSLYAIPGLDYVAHEDIIPYASAEKAPLNHELFDKFLAPNPNRDPPFIAQETLKAWQNKNHPWLELSDVHKETTENIRVTVIPFYMGCRESHASSVYWWRYCIRLENLGNLSVQLRERHWRIFSLSGTLETVRGRGVVGQEPALTKTLPAFQYSSHVSLQAPSGHMWGTFRMEREDGYTFDCRIPPFSLESKPEAASATPPETV